MDTLRLLPHIQLQEKQSLSFQNVNDVHCIGWSSYPLFQYKALRTYLRNQALTAVAVHTSEQCVCRLSFISA